MINLNNIKFGVLKESIGHAIYNPTIYFGDIKKNQITIIIYSKKKLHHYESVEILLKKLSEKHKIIAINSNILFWIMVKLISYNIVKWPILIRFYANIYYAHRSLNYIKYGSNVEMNRPSTILPKCNVSEKDDVYFRTWRRNRGIKKNFICVFSRNNSYYKNEYPDSREGTRNSKFSDLIPTIQMIRELGYDVVRVGRDHGDVFNHKNINDLYFDFDSFDERNKLIDLMLIKNCALFLTSNSGINALAYMFQKRILYHNMFPCGMRPHFKNCAYIMKKYQNNNKLIKYRNIPKKLLLQEDSLILKEMNFQLLDNSPEEIKDFVSNQLNSKFKDVIAPPKDLCVYGAYSFLDKRWFDKNRNLF